MEMQPRITFRAMDHSDALQTYAIEKLQKLNKFLHSERSPIDIDMVLEAHAQHDYYIAELKIHTPHYHLVAKKELSDMYAVIDEVVGKMDRELARAKEKLVDYIHGK